MSETPYTIAVCNFNMVRTLETSLRSMADQVDPDRFEIVVVDGGSTDGSRDVLRNLEGEYDNLRAVLDREDECDWLGGDRNISFQESRGEYVLESLDTDDRYHHGIIDDFVRIFHAIDDHRTEPTFLSGQGVNMAPRDLLLDVPYRDVGGAEDRDLWRRLFDRDALVWLDHGEIGYPIGYEFGPKKQIQRDIHGKVTDFRTGVTLRSCLRYTFEPEHPYVLERKRSVPLTAAKRLYDLLTYPYAYYRALGTESWPAPDEFKQRGALERRIVETRRTLPELEQAYGFELDRDEVSDAGWRAFVEYARD